MREDENLPCRAKALRTHGAHGANSSLTRQACSLALWCAKTLKPCICSVRGIPDRLAALTQKGSPRQAAV